MNSLTDGTGISCFVRGKWSKESVKIYEISNRGMSFMDIIS